MSPERKREMSPKEKTLLAAGILALYLLTTDVFCPLYQSCKTYVLDNSISSVVTPLIAIMFGLYALGFHGFRSSHGKAMTFFVFGTIFAFLANVTWALSRILYGLQVPGVLSGVLWLMAFPCFFISMLFVWRMVRSPPTKTKFAIMIALMVAVSLVVAIPLLSAFSNMILPVAVAAIYLVLDMIISCQLVAIIIYAYGSRLLRVWGAFLLAMAFMAAGHAYYLMYYVQNLPSPSEFFFNLSYVLMALGFLYNRSVFRSATAVVPRRKSRSGNT
jgi:hypothetical protein